MEAAGRLAEAGAEEDACSQDVAHDAQHADDRDEDGLKPPHHHVG